jgi:hypothetical protein
MLLYVKTLDNHIHSFDDIDMNVMTVFDMKQLIEKTHGFLVDDQILIFAGRIMKNEHRSY